jgi:translation elongation factor EF-1alpha
MCSDEKHEIGTIVDACLDKYLTSLTFLFKVVVLDYKSIICPGKTFVMHLQAIIEEVTLKALICLVRFIYLKLKST